MTISEALGALNSYPPVRRRIAHADVAFLVTTGDTEAQLAFAGGEIVETKSPPVFSIRVAAEAWTEYCKPVPKPGSHDFGAMAETGKAWIEGEVLELYRYYPVLRDVITALAGKELGR